MTEMIEQKLIQEIQQIIQVHQEAYDDNIIHSINLSEIYPQLSQLTLIEQIDEFLFIIQDNSGLLWLMNVTDMSFKSFELLKQVLCEQIIIIRDHKFIIMCHKSTMYFIQLKCENNNFELELIDIYEVDSRNDTQIKNVFFNTFFDKEFYVLQLFVLTKQNQIIQINKGYCEYEERVIIDLEGSEQGVLDIAYLKGKLYVLLKDQYIAITQETTEYFELNSEYNKLENININMEDKLLFIGQNKVSFDGVGYLFDNYNIIDVRDKINQKNIKQLLLQGNKQLSHVQFNLESSKLNVLFDLSKLKNTINIKALFEINSTHNSYLLLDNSNNVTLITKLNFLNYILISMNINVDNIKFAEIEMKSYVNQIKKAGKKYLKNKNKSDDNNLIYQYENNKVNEQNENNYYYLLNKQNNGDNKILLQTSGTQQLHNNNDFIENDNIEETESNSLSEQLKLESDTQTFLKCIREYDAKKTLEEDDDQLDLNEQKNINNSLKYSNISDMFYRFEREKQNQQVIVDIMKEGIYKNRIQYNKFIYQGKSVNKQTEVCQICKKQIINTNEEKQQQQIQQGQHQNRKQIEGKLFFLVCRHTFHKHCILLSPNYSSYFKQNQCPLCSNYEHLQELPPQSFM